MNYRYIKKPVIIEAFQMTHQRMESNEDWPQWLHEAWNKDRSEVGALCRPQPPFSGVLIINSLEGLMTVSSGDYIIQGVKGELYPCKPDIFEMTYALHTEGEGV